MQQNQFQPVSFLHSRFPHAFIFPTLQFSHDVTHVTIFPHAFIFPVLSFSLCYYFPCVTIFPDDVMQQNQFQPVSFLPSRFPRVISFSHPFNLSLAFIYILYYPTPVPSHGLVASILVFRAEGRWLKTPVRLVFLFSNFIHFRSLNRRTFPCPLQVDLHRPE